MKRFAALVLAVLFCLGGASAALADGIDIKVKGEWDFAFGWVNNHSFRNSVNQSGGSGDYDNFQAAQRVRTQINFIASENLQGVLMFEIGVQNWGQNNGRSGPGSGAGIDADGVNVETRRAYLDWMIPDTDISVRMGIQGVTLPSTPMGSPLFDNDVAGVVINSPITDWLGATAFWLRPLNNYLADPDDDSDGVADNLSDEVDIFGLLLPMNFADAGVSFTPWFMYGFLGVDSGLFDYVYASGSGNNADFNPNSEGKKTHAWWAGAHLELTAFDPLTFNIEAIYGRLSKAETDGFGSLAMNPGDSTNIGTRGWYIGATLDYTLDWATPGIFGWWASGDDKNSTDDGMLGRMPALGQDGTFLPTSFGSYGFYGISQMDTAAVLGTGTGTWGIGIQLAEMSFIEDLSHTLRLAYYRGTNDSELIESGENYYKYSIDTMYLTDKDSVIEVNFDHQYKIYENLTAVLELGWLHLSTDEDTWRRFDNGNLDESDDAWKAQILFKYSF